MSQVPLGAPQGPRRQPVRSIGQPDPAGMRPKHILDMLMGSVQIDEMGRMLANKESLDQAPPWAVELMNQCRKLHIEVASQNLALIRRGLLTIEELQEAREEINKQIEEQFREMISQIQRGANQAPTPPPP